MRVIHFMIIGLLFFGLVPKAQAAPNQMPRISVTDNTRADSLGIFANNQAGINMCWSRLAAGTARFYVPTDVRGHDPSARTAPLEANTCARMRVRGGLIGVVALREGSLVNLGQRDGHEQPVAYNKCNNWLELLSRPAQNADIRSEQVVLPRSEMNVKTEQPQPQRVRQEQIIEVQPVIIYRYLPPINEGQMPQSVDVRVPAPTYRPVYQNVTVPVQKIQPRCICYWPPDDPSVTQLYRFPYPDRAGQWWCVPLQMAQTNTPPPGFVR